MNVVICYRNWDTYKVVDGLTLAREAASAIRHQTLALGCSHFNHDNCETRVIEVSGEIQNSNLFHTGWSSHSCKIYIRGTLVNWTEQGIQGSSGVGSPAV